MALCSCNKMTDETTTITLRRDEALLVDAFLRRFTDKDILEPTKGEAQALFNLGCLLECELAELFDPNYADILKQAEIEVFRKEG